MTSLADKLPERLAHNPLQSMRSDSDLEAIAEALLPEVDGDERFFKDCGKHLLLAVLGYLRDWCKVEQRSIGNVNALLKAALPSVPGRKYTDLDNLFYEIESGCKRVISADGITTGWEVSSLERGDGTRPRDTNGISPTDDFSLGNYKQFSQASKPTRDVTAASLLDALAKCEG